MPCITSGKRCNNVGTNEGCDKDVTSLQTGYGDLCNRLIELNVIIPDTNVILAASININYEETIHNIKIQHIFHDESSQLFYIINDEEHPKVMGILLEKIESESRGALMNTIKDPCEDATVELVVKKAVKKLTKKN